MAVVVVTLDLALWSRAGEKIRRLTGNRIKGCESETVNAQSTLSFFPSIWIAEEEQDN